MHKEQKIFCNEVRSNNSLHFKNRDVLDVGSLDINGNNRYLFERCAYTGLDIIKGRNVDIVQPICQYASSCGVLYDVVISTEMLEHDKEWKESVLAMYSLVKKGGLLLVTCATTGRPEHGTSKNKPKDSPATNDYYQNISSEMFLEAIKGLGFTFSRISINKESHDLYFYGIKA
jgi:cyclopropane fatty-acyl-phospholipid synthase-like methyltransferase